MRGKVSTPGTIMVMVGCLLASVPLARASIIYDVQLPQALYGNLDQRHVPGIGNIACAPTSCINSFVYLQNAYPGTYDNLLVPQQGSDLNGDQIVDQYDDMIAACLVLAGQPYMRTGTTGAGTWIRDIVWGKDLYVNAFAPGTTVFSGMLVPLGQYNPTTNPGGWTAERPPAAWVTETAPTWQFLHDELQAGEDVEIVVTCEEFGHCLTLTSFHWEDDDEDGFIDQTETAWIDYIDPWGGIPGQSNVWESGGMLETDYGLSAYITMALSESIPEPATLALLGLALVMLARRGSRRP